jgi:hypothetical protein
MLKSSDGQRPQSGGRQVVTSTQSGRGIRRGSLALIAAALLLALAVPAAYAWPSPWVISPHPISVAYNGQSLLMTGGDEANTECTNDVTAWDMNGQSSLFARLRNRPGCIGSELETYMYTVPEYEPLWPTGTTYAVHGSHIYAIDQNGNWQNFSNGPCNDNDIPGVTIDTGGNWGHLMFVTCSNSAKVFTIDNAGVPRLFLDLSQPPVSAHFLEAPVIAPRGFAQPSRLLITDEATNRIYSISPWDDSRSVSVMATFNGIEHIDFIPQNLCTYGNTGGAFFSAVPSSTGGEIDKRPPADFAGYSNAAVLSSEYGQGLAILTGPDNVIPFQYGYDHNRTYEGSTFMTYKQGCGAVTDWRGYSPTGVPLGTWNPDAKIQPGAGTSFATPMKTQAIRQRLRKPPPKRLRIVSSGAHATSCARRYVRFRGTGCSVPVRVGH